MNAGCFKCSKAQWDADGCTCEITGLLVGNAERGCEYRKDIELKPCPFCGARAFVVGYKKATYVDGHWMPKHIESYKVVAEHYATCVLRDMTSGIGFSTEEQAVEHWNRRIENE